MKIRVGFVSNSSSSSFLVAFNRDKIEDVCPHCGRKDMSIFDLIERNNGNNDTEIRWRGGEDRVIVLRNEIQEMQAEMRQLKDLDFEKSVSQYWTAGEKLKWIIDVIGEKEKEIKLIEEALNKGLDVAYIDISYHDDLLNGEFNSLVKTGKLEILVNDN